MKPVPRQSRPEHEQAYALLKSEIMSGVFAPGTKLSIKRLSDAYAFGFTPTREAVRRLGTEGAVEIEPKKAMRIPILSKKAAADIYRLRTLIEPEVAARAARASDAVFVKKLKVLVKTMEQSLRKDSPLKYLRANQDFHFSIYRQGDIHLSIHIIEMLWLQMGPLQAYYTAETRSMSPNLHRDIVDAMATNDARKAKSSLREDIECGIDSLLVFVPE
ncbi:MAG: GntR family transcriptional regulator [Pseudomonadota bacterium]